MNHDGSPHIPCYDIATGYEDLSLTVRGLCKGVHIIGPPSHWSPISLAPQLAPMHHPFHWSPISFGPLLIGTQFICPPRHCLNSLVSLLIGPPFHQSTNFRPIPMVPHLIGPPSHLSPNSLGPNLMGCPSHWPLLIGSPIHRSPNTLLELIGPTG